MPLGGEIKNQLFFLSRSKGDTRIGKMSFIVR